jgi:TATA-box binding protein (TBP) (component of TFIID and TFIIIB)
MGLKKALTQDMVDNDFPLHIRLVSIQSTTWSVDFQAGSINMIQLNDTLQMKSVYEGELFPALRLVDFKPLCVNIFHSGKCIITGIRALTIDSSLLGRIFDLAYCHR